VKRNFTEKNMDLDWEQWKSKQKLEQDSNIIETLQL
jgi:hypothetical protein